MTQKRAHFVREKKQSRWEGGVEERYFETVLEVMWYFH